MNYGISDFLSEVTKFLISNRLNSNSKCNYIIILSLFSGFPSSAVYLKKAYENKEISKEELEYMLSFCFFSNPLFVIGTIGSLLLGNKRIGIMILFSHYISNFIIAYIFRKKTKNKEKVDFKKAFNTMKNKISTSKPLANVLKDIIIESIDTLLLLLGIISIFLIISNVLLNEITEPFQSIINGILEMTGGIKRISSLDIAQYFKIIFILFFISFGGISIHIQILSILDKIKINYKRFVFKRILSSIISILVFSLFYLWY